MKHLFHYLIIFIFLLGCNSIVRTVYGTNKEINFSNKIAYTSWAYENYKIDSVRFYFISKDSYFGFIKLVAESRLDYFYGIFENDSVTLNKSSQLSKNESCLTRVLVEISALSKNEGHVNRKRDSTFFKMNFQNFVTNLPLKMTNNYRKKVFLIFSYKAGKVTKNDFEQIQQAVDKLKDYDLYIISLDKIYDLP